MKTTGPFYSFITLALRAGLAVALFIAGWMVYSSLPEVAKDTQPSESETTLQIVLRNSGRVTARRPEISIEIYPVDIVAVRHEYFTERRAGKRFDDFLSERMKGRKPVTASLDQQGQTSVVISPGDWWLHALLSGEEHIEWRMPITIAGRKQTVELTSQNVYTRTRSF